jgi:hypothetical protein
MQLLTNQRHFLFGLISLCALYLGLEISFNNYALFSADEFWFAHNIYHYKDGLPYRDFPPYKTVLGYYLLLLPMLSGHGLFPTLIFTKNMIATFNTLVLFFSACCLTRFFSRPAVLTSLALIICTENIIFYSTNIRVDLPGYWFCLFSILLLLEKRFLFAGLILGFGFITTQKTLWYIFASNCALGMYWLTCQRDLKSMMNIIRYNLMTGMVISAYIFFWAWLSDWHTVIHSIFYEASVMYHLAWYDYSRMALWGYIASFNPILFLFWPLTPLSLMITFDGDDNYQRRIFIIVYAFVIACCFIPFKQAFPYYMQVAIPVSYVLYAAFFSWLFCLFNQQRSFKFLVSKYNFYLYGLLYAAFIVYAYGMLRVPAAYLQLCLIPVFVGIHIGIKGEERQRNASIFFTLTMIVIMFTGCIYPLAMFSRSLFNLNGAYQKANVQAVNTLLRDGSDYVAGVELIYDKTQPISGMRHLMAPAVGFLEKPSAELRAVMLRSLYEDPNTNIDSVITAMKESRVKLYVNNYRMQMLPIQINSWLASEYEHYWGSIYLYAPVIAAGKNAIQIKFSGHYLIESADNIMIDGKKYHQANNVYLKQGAHNSSSRQSYRLKLLANDPGLYLPRQFQEDDAKMIII